jgi:hypothetical protein
VGKFGELVPTLFLAHTLDLDLQVSYFKMMMGHNFEQILWEENNFNPFIKLWHKVFKYLIFNLKLSEFIKIANITAIQVLGFVEDE